MMLLAAIMLRTLSTLNFKIQILCSCMWMVNRRHWNHCNLILKWLLCEGIHAACLNDQQAYERPLPTGWQERVCLWLHTAIDLSPHQKCTDHYSLIKTGNLTAEVHFAGALITINMVMYSILDNMIKIKQQKHMFFNQMQVRTLSSSLGFFFPCRFLQQRSICRHLPSLLVC